VAECVVEGEQLVVRLSAIEKLESVHPDFEVPLSAIRSVEVAENLMTLVHGMRVGTGIPGSTAVGTFTSKTARIFGAIHHGEHRGVRIVLDGQDYDEILIGCDDAETVATSIPVSPPSS